MTIALRPQTISDLASINPGLLRLRESEITIITLHQCDLHFLSLMSAQAGKYHLLSLALSLAVPLTSIHLCKIRPGGWVKATTPGGAAHCHHEPPPPSPSSTDTAFLCVSSELFSTKSSFKQVSIIQCVLVLTVSVCAHLNLFVSTKNPTVTTLVGPKFTSLQTSLRIKMWF